MTTFDWPPETNTVVPSGLTAPTAPPARSVLAHSCPPGAADARSVEESGPLAAAEHDAQHQAMHSVTIAAPATLRPSSRLVTLTGRSDWRTASLCPALCPGWPRQRNAIPTDCYT